MLSHIGIWFNVKQDLDYSGHRLEFCSPHRTQSCFFVRCKKTTTKKGERISFSLPYVWQFRTQSKENYWVRLGGWGASRLLLWARICLSVVFVNCSSWQLFRNNACDLFFTLQMYPFLSNFHAHKLFWHPIGHVEGYILKGFLKIHSIWGFMHDLTLKIIEWKIFLLWSKNVKHSGFLDIS